MITEEFSQFLERKPIVLQIIKFGAIGVLNTALDFLVLNWLSKIFGISSGSKLGTLNIVGFALAVVQSYFWNRYWAFSGEQTVSFLKNFTRLVLVGAVGFVAFGLALLGSKNYATPVYFFIIFIVYVIAEVVLWYNFGFSKIKLTEQKQQFVAFLLVSLVGLFINSLLVGNISSRVFLGHNADLSKNIAKLVATFGSLLWNFVGYKLFVFKK